jgi:salicylate hydroxylase
VTGVHRGQFQTILVNRLHPNCKTHLSKRLVSYTQSPDENEPVCLTFDDGSTATCDVLIGADGVRSVVRQKMVDELAVRSELSGKHDDAQKWRDFMAAKFSGVLVYRTVIPSEKLAKINPNHNAFKNGGAGVSSSCIFD